MILYDRIGQGYNSTRRADPYISQTLNNLLSPGRPGPCLDVGCGTGNYLESFQRSGLEFYGLDPSETMLEQARAKDCGARLVKGNSEQLPFEDNYFYGATAVLTFHHWRDLRAGLKEIHRVLKPGRRLAAFSFAPDPMRGYWLYHYFPGLMEHSLNLVPEREDMRELLLECGFRSAELINYFIQPDLCDHFLYSYKHTPEKYLDEQVRRNISSFRTEGYAAEQESGTARLKEDIASGRIQEVMRSYENDRGDYLFICAQK